MFPEYGFNLMSHHELPDNGERRPYARVRFGVSMCVMRMESMIDGVRIPRFSETTN